jgi:uncharacterized protein (DUF302 family)/uncharacterized membrane protein YidH (DUF202 family)
MENPTPSNPTDTKAADQRAVTDPRVYLAAERTYLAWIRTGIALMGFGFIFARFGIFLRQIQLVRDNPNVQSFGTSVWLGVALVIIGVIVNIAATARHVQVVRGLREGRPDFDRPSKLAITIAIILACIGIFTAIYLIIVSASAAPANSQRSFMSQPNNNGVISLASNHSVDDTLTRLQKMLAEKGIKVFALIDHSGEAEKAGLKMRPTKLLIFGNPKAGTPLMLAAPSIAIDLPLKLLVSQDESGKTWISHNSPDYLRDRHHVPQELLANIAVVSVLASKAAEGGNPT